MQHLREVPLGRALVGPFTTLSLGAAAVHFAVAPAHFQEWWAFGLFMALIGWFQALWAIAYTVRPARRLALLGAVVNILTASIWAWSRLYGVPFGPGAGSPEAIGLPDVAATVFELLLVLGLAAGPLGPLRRTSTLLRIPSTTSVRWSALVAVAVALAASVAMTVGMGSMQ